MRWDKSLHYDDEREMESLIIKNNDEAIERKRKEGKRQHNDEGTKTYEQNYVFQPNYVCVYSIDVQGYQIIIKKYETDRIR